MILPGTPQVALPILIGSSVKATLLLALAAAAAYGLRKHSAAVRHQLWALGLVCSLLLPVVALLLPSWHSATLGSAVSLWSTAHAAPGNAAYPNLSSMIVDAATASSFSRSEEHTSELQSRLHLVCRLLLEKKKNTPMTSHLSLSIFSQPILSSSNLTP